MNRDERIALVLGALWRIYEGRMDRFRPSKQIPKEIEEFLAGSPDLPARQAALLAILDSIISEEAEAR